MRDLPIATLDRALADVLDGGVAALRRVAERPPDGSVRRHRLHALLAGRAEALGLAGPRVDGWRRERLALAARWMLLAETEREAHGALAASGVAWAPIKGLDVARRFYPRREDRPTSDLDFLVRAAGLERARTALEARGWSGVRPGEEGERYLRDEGYAWVALRPREPVVELHFRLWGIVPEGLSEALLDASRRDPELPAGGRRLTVPGAWLLAAVHPWLDPPPRPLLGWWDLERIARSGGPGLCAEVIATAERWGLQLPVTLSASYASSLWRHPRHERIAEALAGGLRWPERRVVERAARRGLDAVSSTALGFARLVARRRSRSGWRAARRQLWPHARAVELGTPEGRPWLHRRITFTLRNLRALIHRSLDRGGGADAGGDRC